MFTLLFSDAMIENMKKNKIKKLFILIGMSVFMFSFFGCSKSSNRIVIYTCQEEERIQAMKSSVKEAFPELNVVIEQVGTGNLAAKIKSEGKNIEADIVIDLEASHMENLKDCFADLSGYNTSAYLDEINPNHNKYVMWVKNHAAITVDVSYFEQNDLSYPTSYEDLLDDKYKDLIAMPDPTTSGTGYAYYLNIVNLKGKNGAINYFEQLSSNIKQYTQSGSGPISLLKQGEIAIAMGMEFQGVTEINNGSNYKIIELDTGAPYNQTGAAIIDGKQDKESVKELFEYLINDFHYVDCEKFVPGKLLKNQETKIPNYVDMKDADMEGLDDIELKQDLLGKWDLS